MINCQRETGPVMQLATLDEILDFFDVANTNDLSSQQKVNFYTLLSYTFDNNLQETLTHLGLFAHHYTMAWQARGYNPLDHLTIMIMPQHILVSTSGAAEFMRKNNIRTIEQVIDYTQAETMIRDFCV